MPFETQQACETALSRLTYWVKFEQFKIEGRCQKLS